jgi:hypothetical protein
MIWDGISTFQDSAFGDRTNTISVGTMLSQIGEGFRLKNFPTKRLLKDFNYKIDHKTHILLKNFLPNIYF